MIKSTTFINLKSIMVPFSLEKVSPRTAVVSPRTDKVLPRTEVVSPRTNKVSPRTELVFPRTNKVSPRTEVVPPRTKLAFLRTNKVPIRTKKVFIRNGIIIKPPNKVSSSSNDVVLEAVNESLYNYIFLWLVNVIILLALNIFGRAKR